MDNLRTNICDQFNIKVPIFGLTHNADVTIALAEAGAFPVLALGRTSVDEAESLVADIRNRIGGKPWGINCLLTDTLGEEESREAAKDKLPLEHVEFVRALQKKFDIPPAAEENFFSSQVRSNNLNRLHAEIALESGASAFSTAIGVPPEIVARAKACGMITIASVGAPKHAVRAVEADIDVLVAQGYDAGGHTGPIGTFSLIPQIVDVSGGRPVLAAGGVGDGRQIAASFAMGAEGAWLGTAWLTTVENHTDDQLLEKYLGAGSSDTVLTRAHSGKTARVLSSDWISEWLKREAPEPLPMPYQQVLTGEIMAAIEEHQIEALRYDLCGQSIVWFNEKTTVRDVIERLVKDTIKAIKNINKAAVF